MYFNTSQNLSPNACRIRQVSVYIALINISVLYIVLLMSLCPCSCTCTCNSVSAELWFRRCEGFSITISFDVKWGEGHWRGGGALYMYILFNLFRQKKLFIYSCYLLLKINFLNSTLACLEKSSFLWHNRRNIPSSKILNVLSSTCREWNILCLQFSVHVCFNHNIVIDEAFRLSHWYY